MRALKDKVVVLTGAAGGIGRAISRRFLEEGAKLVALDLNADGLMALAEEMKPVGKIAKTLPVDITNHAAVKAAMVEVNQELGRIDVLVNNAGWDIAVQFVDSTPEHWEKLIAINLTGVLNMHHAVLPIMIAQGGGMVVNISSDAGRVGSSGESVYAACKGGIISFTKTVARETAQANIRLNVVCPGPTDTPLLQSFLGEGEYGKKIYEGLKRSIPLKRLGQPDDLAGIVAFLSSEDAKFITGQVISVSGGLTMHG